MISRSASRLLGKAVLGAMSAIAVVVILWPADDTSPTARTAATPAAAQAQAGPMDQAPVAAPAMPSPASSEAVETPVPLYLATTDVALPSNTEAPEEDPKTVATQFVDSYLSRGSAESWADNWATRTTPYATARMQEKLLEEWSTTGAGGLAQNARSTAKVVSVQHRDAPPATDVSVPVVVLVDVTTTNTSSTAAPSTVRIATNLLLVKEPGGWLVDEVLPQPN